MRSFIFLFAAGLLTACSTYRSGFDSGPSAGVRGASVCDIEEMIVESPSGADFLTLRGANPSKSEQATKGRVSSTSRSERGCERRRLWVPTKTTPEGYTVSSHFIWETKREER